MLFNKVHVAWLAQPQQQQPLAVYSPRHRHQFTSAQLHSCAHRAVHLHSSSSNRISWGKHLMENPHHWTNLWQCSLHLSPHRSILPPSPIIVRVNLDSKLCRCEFFCFKVTKVPFFFLRGNQNFILWVWIIFT